MAKISGKWKFNDVLTLVGNMWYVDYSYSGTECYALTIGVAPPAINNLSLWYETKNIGQVQVYMEGPGWLGNYKTIDFGVTEQTVDDSFYEWLTANATKVLTIADKLAIITANEQKVYEAGLNKGGYAGGYADGYEQGKKTEYDAFWDRFQQNGTLTYFPNNTGVFAAYYWGFNNFYPKYDIKPKNNASQLFYNWNTSRGDPAASLKQRLEECGVVLDTSQATNLNLIFAYCSGITEIPTIDCTGLTEKSGGLFRECGVNLKTIEKIIVKESVTFANWFDNDTGLTNIVFDGVIGQDISFAQSTELSADSIINIIEHLSLTASGKTLTLSKAAVDKAFEESEGANNGSQSREWEHWIGTKQTWTISLV